MKRRIFVIINIILLIANASFAYCKEGDSGYEGGLSSCQNLATSKNTTQFEYQEVVFLTGKPIVMKGTVTIKKKVSNNIETTTYTYSIADDNENTLKRTVSLATKITNKDNKQVTKETSISGKPTETVAIGSKTFTLSTYNLTKTSIVDQKPVADYFAGTLESKKVYLLKDNDDTVTLLTKGQFYGYNHNWSSGEVQMLDYTVEGKTANDNWSGSAKVKSSSVSTTDFKYMKNYPEEISFDGGYIQSQSVNNKLIYQSDMPEFDKDGISTDRIITEKGNLKIDTFPNDKRLTTYNLSQIRGHWAEEDIKKLYGLEIFDESPVLFLPNQYITRAEFAKVLYKVMNANTEVVTTTKKAKTVKVSPQYEDVPVNDPYFTYISAVTNKGIMVGYGDGKFYPNDLMTRAQIAQTFVNMLGLEGMSKDEYPVTIFKDNDNIPRWALRSVYVANKIGIMKGDNNCFNPNNYLTKAEAATAINRFIQYVTKDMGKSYSDKILNY